MSDDQPEEDSHEEPAPPGPPDADAPRAGGPPPADHAGPEIDLAPARPRAYSSIEGPSHFLHGLMSKMQGDRRVGNSAADVQRIRFELTNKVQVIMTDQESHASQFESQLAVFSQEMKTRLANLERQQGFTKKQLDEIHERVQTLTADELSTLQFQFDELDARFDRFMRVEVEAKMRPMQDELRKLKARLDELNRTTDSTSRKLTGSVKSMTQKVKTLSESIGKKQRDVDVRLRGLGPKLASVEQEMEDLSGALKGPSGSESAMPENLTKKLSEAQSIADQLQSETIPLRIQENSDAVLDAMAEISQYCDEKLAKLQSRLDKMTSMNQIVEQQRAQTEQSLDQLLKGCIEIQGKIQTLDQDANAKLTALEQSFETTSATLNAQLNDSDGPELADPTEQINTEITALRARIHEKCKKLKAEIKVASGANQQAQAKAAEEVSKIRDAVLGQGNLIERLGAIEAMAAWCIDHIKMIDADRIEAQKEGGSPQNVAARIANIKARLEAAAGRLGRIKGMQDDAQKPPDGNPQDPPAGEA
jgi:hypothetical protein